MKLPQTMAIRLALLFLLAISANSGAQTWTTLTNTPPAPLGTALLLTDGTVMVQGMATTGYGTGNWYRLTPSSTGSYIAGTWTTLASMPSGYSPLYYASAVLPDGRLVAVGGEYNNGAEAETNLGAIYNPATNAWTSITAPSGWTHIGDAASVVLPNGTFMIGNCGVAGTECTNQTYQAQLNASTLTWTIIGSGNGKADQNSEEGWELLPNGDVLAVDVWDGTNSEVFNPSTSKWSSAGSTVVSLPNTSCVEIGPAVLRPEGSVFAVGGTSNTAIYSTSTGTWSAGPTIPSSYGVEDGPAAILPDGNVLIDVSAQSPCYTVGSHFYEFNGTSLTAVTGPSRAASDATYVARMLVLPTGQILFTDGTTTTQIYTASGTYQSSWQPTISSVASTLTPGSTNNLIEGTQFNGLSQGAAYGDDAQMATNYPLVRITNTASGKVVYCKTHNHSTMGVATGSATVSTEFDVPSTIGTGPSTLQVVANGIPSAAFSLTVGTGGSGFTYTGSMSTPRDSHSATLLPSGLVLAAGGYNGSSYVGSAELYNSATGTFTLTGSMNTPRAIHTGTLLQNGMVLVAGGYSGSALTASAEIYNPATGRFTVTGSLNVARDGHTATLLQNGMVLIAGGDASSGSTASAELYNPATGKFTLTGNMNDTRNDHTATLLSNGSVLIAGGYGSGSSASAELYNPATGTFTLTGSMSFARYTHTATLLGSGLVLVTGGVSGSGDTATAELYNPASGTFAVTGSMSAARNAHTATLLGSGSVLVAGGCCYLASAELFNPSTGTFSSAGNMNTARVAQRAVLLQNGSVLVSGGYSGSAYLASAELYP